MYSALIARACWSRGMYLQLPLIAIPYIAYPDAAEQLLVTYYKLLVTSCELLVTHITHLGKFTVKPTEQ